ncbi:MAG: PIN domain-containing protein [Thermoleophilaceae bacterium]|jgi:predicted nucleic acid-binding protein|nr:PIN domain-containing protein [Thermoleophilaceae bacterium]
MTAPYGGGTPLVFDTSAWNRQRAPGVRERWLATLDAGLLAVCPLVALEVLRAARDEAQFAMFDRDLSALAHRNHAPVTAAACAAAQSATRELKGARRGIPALDMAIAAAAAERGFGVLHHDRHFDLLSGPLGFQSVRI